MFLQLLLQNKASLLLFIIGEFVDKSEDEREGGFNDLGDIGVVPPPPPFNNNIGGDWFELIGLVGGCCFVFLRLLWSNNNERMPVESSLKIRNLIEALLFE